MDDVTVKIGADASRVRPAIDDSKQSLSELGDKVIDTKQGMADLANQVAEASKELINGANPLTVFAEHSRDVFSAISQVSGVTTGFVGLMSGSWGIVIASAAGILGEMLSKLVGTRDALANVKFAADDMGTAQKILGAVMDVTTGKIKNQRSELITLGIAQAKVNELQARTSIESASQVVKALGARHFRMDGGFGGGLSMGMHDADPQVKRLIDRVLKGMSPDATDADKAAGDPVKALDELEVLQLQGKITKDVFQNAAKAISDFGIAAGNIKINEATERLLRGEGTSADRKLMLTPPAPPAAKTLAPSSSPSSPSTPTTVPSNEPEGPVHISGDFSQPLELSPGSKDKFVNDIKSTFQNVSKVIGATADDQKAKWKSVADSISNAFGSSLEGMIKGTQNFRGMMLNIGNAILGEATKWIEKKVSNFISGELAQTAATAGGVASRTTVEATGAATSAGISATSALTQIGHSAAVAAAGAYAAIAKIAFVGPVLAPLAAAAALAGVLALGKSIFSAEGGMGQVPYDGAMFELHKDEMVLPARLATPMRSMLLNPASNNNSPSAANSNSSVNSDVHLHIHAVDTQSGVDFLMRNKHAVARAVNGAVRNGFKAKG